jgi:hypothetical protein
MKVEEKCHGMAKLKSDIPKTTGFRQEFVPYLNPGHPNT